MNEQTNVKTPDLSPEEQIFTSCPKCGKKLILHIWNRLYICPDCDAPLYVKKDVEETPQETSCLDDTKLEEQSAPVCENAQAQATPVCTEETLKEGVEETLSVTVDSMPQTAEEATLEEPETAEAVLLEVKNLKKYFPVEKNLFGKVKKNLKLSRGFGAIYKIIKGMLQ